MEEVLVKLKDAQEYINHLKQENKKMIGDRDSHKSLARELEEKLNAKGVSTKEQEIKLWKERYVELEGNFNTLNDEVAIKEKMIEFEKVAVESGWKSDRMEILQRLVDKDQIKNGDPYDFRKITEDLLKQMPELSNTSGSIPVPGRLEQGSTGGLKEEYEKALMDGRMGDAAEIGKKLGYGG